MEITREEVVNGVSVTRVRYTDGEKAEMAERAAAHKSDTEKRRAEREYTRKAMEEK